MKNETGLNGEVFKSEREMCLHYGLAQKTYQVRRNRGMSKKEALETPLKKKYYDGMHVGDLEEKEIRIVEQILKDELKMTQLLLSGKTIAETARQCSVAPKRVISVMKNLYSHAIKRRYITSGKAEDVKEPWPYNLYTDLFGKEYPSPDDIEETVYFVFSQMDPMQAHVIERRFRNMETLESIGIEVGRTRERIRQIERDARKALIQNYTDILQNGRAL